MSNLDLWLDWYFLLTPMDELPNTYILLDP